jgi:hypothetical protein
MNKIDRILLNQATIMRSLWLVLEVFAHEHGFSSSPSHLNVIEKLRDAAQEAEDATKESQFTQ